MNDGFLFFKAASNLSHNVFDNRFLENHTVLVLYPKDHRHHIQSSQQLEHSYWIDIPGDCPTYISHGDILADANEGILTRAFLILRNFCKVFQEQHYLLNVFCACDIL